jgi:hypothetical protein
MTLPEIGLHDEAGGSWLKQNALGGWCLPAIGIGTGSQQLDFRAFEDAGIRVIVRLNYGFEPAGTLPDPDNQAETNGFIAAVIKTMELSKGVSGYVLGNEPNNPAEFPNKKPISAAHYVNVYNRVWKGKPVHAKLAPAAIDPYFGPFPPAGALPYEPNNLIWWKNMLAGIIDADFFTIHCKTQDSNPANIDSATKFGDDPLKWQFIHVRSYEPLLQAIPARLRPRAIHATEVNPQRHNDMATLGWQPDLGATWVKEALAHFRDWNTTTNELQVNSVIFYRFAGDPWALQDKGSILEAIRTEIMAN